MPTLPRYGEPDGDAERRGYAGVIAQSFAGDTKTYEGWLKSFGPNVRVLRGAGVEAGLVYYDMGQYFGGVAVPTWGVAGVAVKPELRAGGRAREIMHALLKEQFDGGPALSTLYPAAPKLYRNLGWEFAGSRLTYVARIPELPLTESPVVIRQAGEADAPLIRELYARRYAGDNGCLQRNELIWQRIYRTPEESPLCAYVAENEGEAVGYALYIQRRETPGSFRFDLAVRDLVCLSADAARAFVSYFARHRSVANNVYFPASLGDALLAEIARTQEVRVHERFDWMLRIVRVKDALEARGYSAHVSAEAALNVSDDTLPGNRGQFKLALADGRMNVKASGKGGADITIAGLAALYSARMTPAQLRFAGMLSGSKKHDVALTAMFAGQSAWMPDFF